MVVWLIVNTRYNKCGPVNDLPEVQASFETTIFKLFLSLGVKSENFKIAHNSKKLYLKQKNELLGRLYDLESKREDSADKLLLFVLYAGNGVMRKEHTNIMFNEESD